MEKLNAKVTSLKTALHTLTDILHTEERTVVVRDATIQRFEYTFETLWKAIKVFLHTVHGVEGYSPKSCFRGAVQVELLTPEEGAVCLQMTDDRNQVAHAYIEEVAVKIYEQIPVYAELMREVEKRLTDV